MQIRRLSRCLAVLALVVGVSGFATADERKASVPLSTPYVYVTFLLDASPSMLTAATQLDVTELESLTENASASGLVKLPANEAPLVGEACAWACHWTATASDYFTLARKAGIRLRIDAPQAAIQTAIGWLFAAERHTGIGNRFGVAIYTFANSLTKIFPTNGLAFGLDLSTNSGGAATAIQNFRIPVTGDSRDTDFPRAMASLAAASTPSGSGAGRNKPRKVLIIITDGIQDWGNAVPVPGYSQTASQGMSGGAEGPINAADCNAMKALGYDVYVLYTTYLTSDLAGHEGPVVAFNEFLVPYINDTGGPSSYDLTPSLMACASSPNNFAQAGGQGVTAAMSGIMQSVIALSHP